MAQPSRRNQRYYPSSQSNNFYRRSAHANNLPRAEAEQTPQTESPTSQNIRYKNWNVADRIALWGLLINFTLAFVTYLLYHLSVKGVEAADLSAKVAEKALVFQRQTQKTADSNQKISTAIQKIKDDATFKLQESALNAQINAIKETQNEFEIENKPFLQITRISVDSPKIGQELHAKFIFYNAGKQPLQIISGRLDVGYATGPMDKDFRFNRPDTINRHGYITSASYQEMVINSQVLLSKQSFELANNGYFKTFLRGIYVYRSTFSNKKYKYTFDYKILKDTFTNGVATIAIIDTTENIK
ncbi:hypothetical protein AB6735_24090 [Mucilaginibacter sp. RCC_168]|uniref:hypothetical protein n=1 Tax=Mucilaginibacter sp. RCC_168 TaxID=3239221 RepID=UPI003525F914